MEQMRNAYNILVGRLKRKKSCARPRCRWEDNIRMDVGDIGWEGVDWFRLAQDRDCWWTLTSMVI
jgi:hypothetical protein